MADNKPSAGPNLDPDEVRKFTMGFMGQNQPTDKSDAQLQLDALRRRASKPNLP